MSGIWKHKLGLSIFGESHGKAIGITVDGLKAGTYFDEDFIQSELNRRRPGYHQYASSRKEADAFEVISGVFNSKLTGSPLTVIIKNTNTSSKDYEALKNTPRPGHADYPSYIKYQGNEDYRGGGHSSGRITAGLVFAGALAKSILKEKNIIIGGQISKIGQLRDRKIQSINEEDLSSLLGKEFPTMDDMIGSEMKSLIEEVKGEHDSIGGEIRCFALNVPAGLGEPFFYTFESVLSQLIYSIPAIKGISFGSGFNLSGMNGSEGNDAFFYDHDKVKTKTNHNGGILGGLTTGMPIDFTVVVKPTPSIGKPQETINLVTKENEVISIHGRHDPCIVPRVVPVIEAALAITIVNFLI
jgi:chorismate synthase